jgi:hypothetical protein
MRLTNGWKRNQSLGFDGGSNAPLVTALDQMSTNPNVPAAPAIYYYRDSGSAKHITAVVRGSDTYLWRNVATSDAWAASWTKFPGGTYNSDAQGVSWGNDRQDVVALGTDRQVYKVAFYGGAWEGGPTSIGAPSVSDSATLTGPTIASKEANQLSVYVIGDGNLWSKTWSSSAWSAWTSLGQPSGHALAGGVGFHPAAVRTINTGQCK